VDGSLNLLLSTRILTAHVELLAPCGIFKIA
jgi:hypothetical protein